MKKLLNAMIFLLPITNFALEFLSMEEFADVRCYSDTTEQVYFQWRGYAYVQRPGERQRLTFEVLGVNVGRCLKDKDGYNLVTREVQFYLNPATSEVMDLWENPWTGEQLTVMHGANSPVQTHLPYRVSLPLDSLGPTKSVGQYIPLAYKNPLFEEKFREYAPQEWFQSTEIFRFSFHPSEPASVGVIRNRVGQFLPWMKMGDREGTLNIVAHGQRYNDFKSLDPTLKQLIEERAPGYKNAPRCFAQEKNATSWTEFKKHFDAYLNHEVFPKDIEEEICSSSQGL